MIRQFVRPLWVRFLLWKKLILSDGWMWWEPNTYFWRMLSGQTTDPNLLQCAMTQDVSILQALESVECATDSQLGVLDGIHQYWAEHDLEVK